VITASEQQYHQRQPLVSESDEERKHNDNVRHTNKDSMSYMPLCRPNIRLIKRLTVLWW